MSGAEAWRAAARCLPLLALLAGCGPAGGGPEAAAAGELSITVEAGVAEADFGRAFPLTVVRSWSEELLPEEWRDRQLAPLVLRPRGVEQRRRDGRIVETLRFDAYAFALGELRLDPVSIRARPLAGGGGPGAERRATAEPLVIPVRPALPGGEAGEVEFPGGPLAAPVSRFPWLPVLVGLAIGVLLLWFQHRQRGRRAAPSASAAPELASAQRKQLVLELLENLARLRQHTPSAAAAFDDDAVEIAGALREFLARAFGLPARERSTEELLELVRGRFGAAAPPLASCLGYCDREKFGPAAVLQAERLRALEQAVVFVEAAAPAEEEA